MPESKVRKEAAEKKVDKRKRERGEKRTKSRARMAMSTRDWVPWVFVPLGLIGVLWLIVFYIAGNRVPVMQDLSNWNYLIGLGLIAASFAFATLWK
ncbi:hypothetical protein GCM10009785_13180 [Brooklawnia cerclae]|uniref:Cell division protein CrgA n=1 Tax=Brooklawnia cerclae TaxID=349934 RepID=A0ABX0SK47_9ACTN|nr:hypothetical protein [Brooklawnia cerclae]